MGVIKKPTPLSKHTFPNWIHMISQINSHHMGISGHVWHCSARTFRWSDGQLRNETCLEGAFQPSQKNYTRNISRKYRWQAWEFRNNCKSFLTFPNSLLMHTARIFYGTLSIALSLILYNSLPHSLSSSPSPMQAKIHVSYHVLLLCIRSMWN